MWEAVDALQRAGQFFRGEGVCKSTCTASCPRSSTVPVEWHFLYNEFPEVHDGACSLNLHL